MTTVDVIIATYNRHERLRRCLAALAAQSVSNFGVIVVDDGSDRPMEMNDFGALASVRVIRTARNSGPAHARNVGVGASRAEAICFIDDDVEACPRLIESHVQELGQPSERRVSIGPLRAPPDWRPTPWNRWEANTLEREYDQMAAGVYSATFRQFFTGNAMVGRGDFEKAGGFDERFTRAEDVELGIRLERVGCTFVLAAQAIGWHYAQRTLESWRDIPRQYARFDRAIDQLHPSLGWQAMLDRERKERSRATRLAVRGLAVARSERAAATVAIASARLTSRVRATRATEAMLSLAFELEYCDSVRRDVRSGGAWCHARRADVPAPDVEADPYAPTDV